MTSENKNNLSSTQHIALRTPATIRIGYSDINVVKAHNEVIEEYGCCGFGKFGAPISNSTHDLINRQIENKTSTNLYVISKSGGEFNCYRAKV